MNDPKKPRTIARATLKLVRDGASDRLIFESSGYRMDYKSAHLDDEGAASDSEMEFIRSIYYIMRRLRNYTEITKVKTGEKVNIAQMGNISSYGYTPVIFETVKESGL